MKDLADRVTRYRNKLEGRAGTLWETFGCAGLRGFRFANLRTAATLLFGDNRVAATGEPRFSRTNQQ